MLIWLTVLTGGIGLLLVSTNSLVSSSQLLAAKWRVSPLIIGTLVVALVTSLPELTISLVAALRHDTQLALGNIIGSNIVNILVVFPAGILAGKLRVGTTKSQRSALFLAAVVFIFFFLSFSPLSSLSIGMILLALLVLYILIELLWAANGRGHEDAKVVKKYSSMHVQLNPVKLFLTVSVTLAGGLCVVFSVQKLAIVTGLSTGFLGLTLAAMSTSLPELFASIFSQEHHQSKETLGDILGSNFYNLLLIGGLVFIISKPAPSKSIELLWLLSTTCLFLFIIRYYQGKIIPKAVALCLLGLSLLYFSTIYLL
ncbi:MAG: inner membrane protein [Microgenomates group bacterium Gr01-1014_16]|nr:MAG: inner membrane protein [Microgenomates group bacterium Gr01-1014_16]